MNFMMLKQCRSLIFVFLTLMLTAGCSLILSNYGVTTDELEKVFAKEIPSGTEKTQVDSFIERYSKTHFKDAEIYTKPVLYRSYSQPNDEKIRDKKNLIESTTGLMIPSVGWNKVNSTYIHVTFYYDSQNRLIDYTMYEAVSG